MGAIAEVEEGIRRSTVSLAERLEARRATIEEAAIRRVSAIAAPHEIADPGYLEGLNAAISAAIEFGIALLRADEAQPPEVPPALLRQARLAARHRVSVDTVLRRYLAGFSLFEEIVMQELEADPRLPRSALRKLIEVQASEFERLIAAVSQAHRMEEEAHRASPPWRQARTVERLLAAEPADMVELAYGFDAWHVGVVAAGPDVVDTIRATAEALDRRLLAVRPEDDLVWAWLGGSARISTDAIIEQLSSPSPPSSTVAIGEASRGLSGWRLTHRQAERAFRLGLRSGEHVVRYGEVGLIAAVLGDDVLANSLHELFLAPLAEERDEGVEARRTLRAYFTTRGNISSAAAALGVSRQTVTSRLHAIEDRLSLSLDSYAVEMEIALRLERGESPRPNR